MRILLINNYLYPRGGAEHSFFRIGRLLESHGHEVIYFACRHPKNIPSTFEHLFPPYHDLRELKLKSLPAQLRAFTDMLYNYTAAANLSRLLQQVQPDLAHLNNIYHHLSPSILPVLARHNVPTVLHLRDGKLTCPAIYMFRDGRFCDLCQHHRIWPILRYRCHSGSLLYSMALALESLLQNILGFYRRYVDLYISPSRFLREQIIRRGYDPAGISLLPNFVNLSAVADNSMPDLPDRYLFCASRLESDKGMFVLLEAARLIPQIPLLIAGDGPARARMEAFIEQHQLSNVRLLGWQNQQQLAELFHRATAAVVPSLLPENCPNVILEAAAQSCPVIAHDVGGITEFIDDGANGWLIPPGQPQRLAQAMSEAFADPQRSANLGAAAQQRVRQRHSPDVFYDSLMDIYAQALERHA